MPKTNDKEKIKSEPRKEMAALVKKKDAPLDKRALAMKARASK